MLTKMQQNRFTKMWVLRQKFCGACRKICEIATPRNRKTHFFSQFFDMVHHQHTPPSLACPYRTHQPSGPRANNHNIVIRSHQTRATNGRALN